VDGWALKPVADASTFDQGAGVVFDRPWADAPPQIAVKTVFARSLRWGKSRFARSVHVSISSCSLFKESAITSC